MNSNAAHASPHHSGFQCLSIIARYHGVACDAAGLEHDFGGSGDAVVAVLRAARGVGLRARRARASITDLSDSPLPAIARRTDGGFMVLARASGHRVLIMEPGSSAPRVASREQLQREWVGELILLAYRRGRDSALGRFGLAWFVPALKKHKVLLAEVLVASLFVQILALLTPLFFQVVVDKVLTHRSLTTLDVLAVGMLLVCLFEVLLGGLRDYLLGHTANRIDVGLGAELYRHLLSLPVSYFHSRRIGDTVARLRELESIRQFLTGSALTVCIDVLFVFVFLVLMYLYSRWLTLVVLAAVPGYLILSVVVTPLLRRRLECKLGCSAENHAFLVESVSGAETLKSHALEARSRHGWEDRLAAYAEASFRTTNLGNIANQIAALINKVVTVLILWLGARAVMQGQLTVGQLVAFNMLAGRVSGPVLRLVQLWQELQQARVALARLGDVLQTRPEWSPQDARPRLPGLRGAVELDGVWFRYQPDSADVLRDLSFKIQPGEIVGVVGRSGCGKSTLTRLLQRLYVPQRGRVLVDGVDLATVDPVWLRRSVGVVLQESFVFNRTVRENIALADPALPMQRVIDAATLAGAHDFIADLPQGYETELTEQGHNLSGGQRQRLALARVLVTDPRILILDEATSALDYESERVIQQNMRAICRNRTVFIIAHRLSALRDATQLLVIDKGCVVECGDHDSLIKRQGRYAHMFASQTGDMHAAG